MTDSVFVTLNEKETLAQLLQKFHDDWHQEREYDKGINNSNQRGNIIMAETLATIQKRKSTRGFKSEQIPAAALDTILKAGEAAPVGMGAFDTIHFTVVQNAELIKKISDAATRGTPRAGVDIFYGAPTLIIVSSAAQPFPGLDLVDAGGIIQNFLLAATDIGIDSVHILGTTAAFTADPELLQLVGIPEGFKVISSAIFGYATEAALAIPKPPRSIAVNRV